MTFLALWLSLAALIYVYAGFPFLVIVLGKWRQRHVRKGPITPRVSLIIAAYNEEDEIAQRLDNALALDYPQESLEIIVASDGSNDATESIVASYANRGVRLLSLPRRGKILAINDAVVQAKGTILVFSDANSIYDRQALRKLVRNFADPQVGGVGGNTIYAHQALSESTSQGEHLYWSYDKWLKQMESLTGSIISAHGAIYAIRRLLYRPLVNLAVTDDFAISTRVIEQGYRLVFEQEAVAYEFALP
ncbi:MAG TPA: glycosyltransferase family 2 protein, partial [Terriglobia bacterium]|nr:glycosyltransferase family 2 protein [Terriglobia bacterium]